MSEPSRDDIPWVNTNEYNENFSQIPYEEQLKYAGQHIAVSLDGKRILAGGADEMEVESKVRQMGLDPSRVVFSYIFPPEISGFIA